MSDAHHDGKDSESEVEVLGSEEAEDTSTAPAPITPSELSTTSTVAGLLNRVVGAVSGAGAGSGKAEDVPAVNPAADPSEVFEEAFSGLLEDVETDPALLGELESLEHAVAEDNARRLEVAEATVTKQKGRIDELRQEIVRKDARLNAYVKQQQKISYQRREQHRTEVASIRRQLADAQQRITDMEEAERKAKSSTPAALAARLAKLRKQPEPEPSVPAPRLRDVRAACASILKGESAIDSAIRWATSSAGGDTAKAAIAPILNWYIELRHETSDWEEEEEEEEDAS